MIEERLKFKDNRREQKIKCLEQPNAEKLEGDEVGVETDLQIGSKDLKNIQTQV